MEPKEDYLNNVKDYGTTPPYHKVEIVRREIIYVPDKENYPIYWEQKRKEELEKLKPRCSCKLNCSHVIDAMRKMNILLNLEECFVIEGFPSQECITKIEEECFEIDRSEILVLMPYYNVTPFVYNQLSKIFSIKRQITFYEDNRSLAQKRAGDKGEVALFLKDYVSNLSGIAIPWQNYVSFLKERGFDISLHAVPGYEYVLRREVSTDSFSQL